MTDLQEFDLAAHERAGYHFGNIVAAMERGGVGHARWQYLSDWQRSYDATPIACRAFAALCAAQDWRCIPDDLPAAEALATLAALASASPRASQVAGVAPAADKVRTRSTARPWLRQMAYVWGETRTRNWGRLFRPRAVLTVAAALSDGFPDVLINILGRAENSLWCVLHTQSCGVALRLTSAVTAPPKYFIRTKPL